MPGPVEFDLRVFDTFLAADATAAATTLTLGHDAGSSFVTYPVAPFWVVLEPDDPSAREDVLVTALTGAAATVVRGGRGGTAREHKAGAPVRLESAFVQSNIMAVSAAGAGATLTRTITFPIPFPVTPTVQATPESSSFLIAVRLQNKSATSIDVTFWRTDGVAWSAGQAFNVHWLAIV